MEHKIKIPYYINNKLDIQGLRCPEPIMLIRKTLRNMQLGETILIIADGPYIKEDIIYFCTFMQHNILINYSQKEPYYFLVCKGNIIKTTKQKFNIK